MSHPNDVYGVASPNPQSGSSQQQQGQQAAGGTYHYGAPPYSYGGAPSYPPMYVRQPQAAGCGTYFFRFAVFLLVFFFIGLFLVMMMAVPLAAVKMSLDRESFLEMPLSEKRLRGNREATAKIAVMSIEGIIMEEEDGFIPKQIRQVLRDEHVAAVVLRIDSPGGSMSGSDYYHHLLRKMKQERDIPVVVSMGSVAASGGYYVAMAGDEIFAEPTTVTGSIGVVVPLYKGVELCKKIGIEATPITSGPLKTMGSFTRPMSDEEEAVWQRLVDDGFERFKQIIRDGRPGFAAEPETLDRLATGQVYTATEAEQNGLVDKIGYLDDAIEAAMNRAGLTDDDSKTIRYRPRTTFADLLESRAPDSLLGAENLVHLTTPRLYLICPHVLPLREK